MESIDSSDEISQGVLIFFFFFFFFLIITSCVKNITWKGNKLNMQISVEDIELSKGITQT